MRHALVGVDRRGDRHVAVCACGYTVESVDVESAVKELHRHMESAK